MRGSSSPTPTSAALKLGGAPDTFLGAGAQTARRLLDKGTIGRVIGGTAYVMSHGMEHWHPSPGFFFQPGAGPIFDVGVYYITTLVSLLGGVKRVAAMASKGSDERLVTAEGPMKGQRIKVTTPTNINAILEFDSGAQVTLGGELGRVEARARQSDRALRLRGIDARARSELLRRHDLRRQNGAASITEIDTADGPFGTANWPFAGPFTRANYRMLGVADLVDAIARSVSRAAPGAWPRMSST